MIHHEKNKENKTNSSQEISSNNAIKKTGNYGKYAALII